MSKRKGRKGFTLAELLVVVAIIAILVAVSIPVFANKTEKARKSTCLANQRAIKAAYCSMLLEGTDESNDVMLQEAMKQCDFEDAKYSGNAITDLCQSGGTISVTFDATTGMINLRCSKHSDDTTGASSQRDDFVSFMEKWLKDGNSLNNKGALYAAYYKEHPAVPMDSTYLAMLKENGLNRTINDPLYWWTYPVTSKDGTFCYNVTFANAQNNSDYWNGTLTQRGKMGGGYVVIVNGKTYIRSQTGGTVEPANTTNKYTTQEQLETALKTAGYIVVE